MSGSTIRVEFPPARMGRELAAYYLQVSPRQLDELRRAGHITARGEGKTVYFPKEELDAYLERQPERPVRGVAE